MAKRGTGGGGHRVLNRSRGHVQEELMSSSILLLATKEIGGK